MEFTDRVVWITGASSGIGEYLSYAFAQSGARLVLSSRKEAELERVRAACPPERDILVLPLDVADFAAAAPATERVLAHFGRIDVLVLNAGISQRARAIDTDLSVDRRIMDVDYFGTIALAKAALPQLKWQRSGRIVVISSVMGKVGTPQRSAYAAAKHALHGFYDSLRAEVHGDGIGVTVICPGYVQTQVSRNALTGDGTAHDQMDTNTAKGLTPQAFARKALRAIAAGRDEVWIGGPREILAVYLNRFFPRLFRKVVRRINTT
jgi:short-subunit dehydrogenase